MFNDTPVKLNRAAKRANKALARKEPTFSQEDSASKHKIQGIAEAVSIMGREMDLMRKTLQQLVSAAHTHPNLIHPTPTEDTTDIPTTPDAVSDSRSGE